MPLAHRNDLSMVTETRSLSRHHLMLEGIHPSCRLTLFQVSFVAMPDRLACRSGSVGIVHPLCERVGGVTDHELLDLRRRAESGDTDAVDELVQLAGERGDMAELRRLADGGNRDAAEVLAELAGELDDEE